MFGKFKLIWFTVFILSINLDHHAHASSTDCDYRDPDLVETANKFLPKDGENNIWYCLTDSNTVIVFVHGFLSDSRKAWLSESQSYWPNILETDPDISGNPSIFLAGYNTITTTGKGILEFSSDLFNTLENNSKNKTHTVLNKKNIVFVAHSAGGIIVRKMLVDNLDAFRKKRIGLVLVASPTKGAKDADRFAFFARLLGNQLGEDLSPDSPILKDTDIKFKNKVIPSLTLAGVEFMEESYPLCKVPIISKIISCDSRYSGIFRRNPIVDAASAHTYFKGSVITGSDHLSISKPTDKDSEIHKLLRRFLGAGAPSNISFSNLPIPNYQIIAADSYTEVYNYGDVSDDEKMNSHYIKEIIKNSTAGLPKYKNIRITVYPVDRSKSPTEISTDLKNKDPDMLVIHRSVFRPPENPNLSLADRNEEREVKIRKFLIQFSRISPQTKIIVYTRLTHEKWDGLNIRNSTDCGHKLSLIMGLDNIPHCAYFVIQPVEDRESTSKYKWKNFLNERIRKNINELVLKQIDKLYQ